MSGSGRSRGRIIGASDPPPIGQSKTREGSTDNTEEGGEDRRELPNIVGEFSTDGRNLERSAAPVFD